MPDHLNLLLDMRSRTCENRQRVAQSSRGGWVHFLKIWTSVWRGQVALLSTLRAPLFHDVGNWLWGL